MGGFFSSLLSVSAAGPYHVRVDGNDTWCTGLIDDAWNSIASPNQPCAFQTPQRGVNALANGETLIIREGTYTTQGAMISTATTIIGLQNQARTTESQRITIRGVPTTAGAEIIFDGQLSTQAGIVLNNVNYATIEGITFQNFTNDAGGFGTQPGVVIIWGSSHDIILRQVKIRGTKPHKADNLATSGSNTLYPDICANCAEVSLGVGTVNNITVENSDIEVRQPYGVSSRPDTTTLINHPGVDQLITVRNNRITHLLNDHRFYGVFGRRTNRMTVEDNYIVDAAGVRLINSTNGSMGVVLRDDHTWTIRNNIIENLGGGIYLWDDLNTTDGETLNEAHVVYNNTIIGTADDTQEDIGILMVGVQDSEVWNNIIINTRFGFRLDNGSNPAGLTSYIGSHLFFNIFGTAQSGTLRPEYFESYMPGGTRTITINTASDQQGNPNFTGSGAVPDPFYRLTSASTLAIDKGDPGGACGSLAEDGDGNGSFICDIGAYEFAGGSPPPPDTTPPTVTLTAPPSGATVAGNAVSLSATASDNVAVAGVEFRVDATSIVVDPSSPYSATWDSTTVPDGAHTITAIATDAAGNTGSNSISVTVDNIPTGAHTLVLQEGDGTLDSVPLSPSYAGTADARLDAAAPGANYGGTISAQVGVFNALTNKSRGVFRFDVSVIPAGSTISQATLELTCIAQQSGAISPVVNVYVLTRPWVESEVTWGNAATGNPWNTPGTGSGDRQATAYPISSPSWNCPATGPYPKATVDLTQAVQAWYGNPSANYGVVLVETETAVNTMKAFATRENAVQGSRPKLTITYTAGASDITAPSQPTGLGATAVSQSGIDLLWIASTDNVGVTGYGVRRGTASGGPYTGVASTTGAAAVMYSDTGLSAGTPYYYVVEAYDAAGNTSSASTEASATTNSAGSAAPPPAIAVASTIATADGGDSGLYEQGTNLAVIGNSLGFCPPNMVWVSARGGFCIDAYEVSTNNLSEPAANPQASVSHADAQNSCLSRPQVAGRAFGLPTSAEWWFAALGTPDPSPLPPLGCNTALGSARLTGEGQLCRSRVGAYDMVGNVAEWISDLSTCDGTDCQWGNTTFRGSSIASGYIVAADNAGVPQATAGTPDPLYSDDYLRVTFTAGTYGIVRGGSFSESEKAGIYFLDSTRFGGASDPTVGFRCVIR